MEKQGLLSPAARRACEETWPLQVSRTGGTAGLLVERARVQDAAALGMMMSDHMQLGWWYLSLGLVLTPHPRPGAARKLTRLRKHPGRLMRGRERRGVYLGPAAVLRVVEPPRYSIKVIRYQNRPTLRQIKIQQSRYRTDN